MLIVFPDTNALFGDPLLTAHAGRAMLGALRPGAVAKEQPDLHHDQRLARWLVAMQGDRRVWRCADLACPVVTFSETHPLAEPRARLTRRAVVWAADALAEDDTTVAALARRLDVDWHTLWEALRVEAERRPAR